MPLVEKIAWSRPADLPGVEILSVENCQRLWTVYHQTYTICTIFAHGGLTDWTYRGKRHVMYNKQISLMEPGEIHRNIKHTAIGSFYVMQIDPALVETMARETGLRSRPHFKVAQTEIPALFDSFMQFHSVLAGGGSLLERQSLLAGSLGRLLAECSESGLRDEPLHSRAPLRRTRDYLHEHYADNVALDALARIAGLSRFHFLRSFTKEFALPPHAYQVKLRVEKARQLLRAGVPIKAIEAGFADQSHLTRHFKKVHGVTPAQYAAMVGAH